ncbi:MAG TPA: hypothetical protein VIO37_05380 [Candidatus Dormibacteraeota bacterium]
MTRALVALIGRIEASWNDLFDYFRDSHAALMAALGKLSDSDLEKPYSHFQPSAPDEKRPVIGWINQLVKESSAAR